MTQSIYKAQNLLQHLLQLPLDNKLRKISLWQRFVWAGIPIPFEEIWRIDGYIIILKNKLEW